LPVRHAASLAQVVGQAEEEALHRYGAQLTGLPAAPATLLQEPLLEAPAAIEQASQLPEQPLLQHTPSAQNPLEHSPAAEHATPRAFCGWHLETVVSQ